MSWGPRISAQRLKVGVRGTSVTPLAHQASLYSYKSERYSLVNAAAAAAPVTTPVPPAAVPAAVSMESLAVAEPTEP